MGWVAWLVARLADVSFYSWLSYMHIVQYGIVCVYIQLSVKYRAQLCNLGMGWGEKAPWCEDQIGKYL